MARVICGHISQLRRHPDSMHVDDAAPHPRFMKVETAYNS